MEKPIRGLIWYPGKIEYDTQALVLLMFIISDSWACLSTKNCLILIVTQPTMWISPFHIHLNLVTREGKLFKFVDAIIWVPSDEWGAGEKREMSSFWSCLLIFLKCLFLDVYPWLWQIFRVRNRDLQLQKSSNVFGVKWSREKHV